MGFMKPNNPKGSSISIAAWARARIGNNIDRATREKATACLTRINRMDPLQPCYWDGAFQV